MIDYDQLKNYFINDAKHSQSQRTSIKLHYTVHDSATRIMQENLTDAAKHGSTVLRLKGKGHNSLPISTELKIESEVPTVDMYLDDMISQTASKLQKQKSAEMTGMHLQGLAKAMTAVHRGKAKKLGVFANRSSFGPLRSSIGQDLGDSNTRNPSGFLW